MSKRIEIRSLRRGPLGGINHYVGREFEADDAAIDPRAVLARGRRVASLGA
jgi:hypothetical protein